MTANVFLSDKAWLNIAVFLPSVTEKKYGTKLKFALLHTYWILNKYVYYIINNTGWIQINRASF